MLGFKVDKMVTRAARLSALQGKGLKDEDRYLVEQAFQHFSNVIEAVLSAFNYDRISVLDRAMIKKLDAEAGRVDA